MADFNAKAATPDSSIDDTNGGVLGFDNQADAAPKVFLFSVVKTWIQGWLTKAMVGLGNVANSLQLIASQNLADLTDLDLARQNLILGYGAARNRFYTLNDCFNGTLISEHWVGSGSGTGSGLSSQTIGTLNACGILSLALGTTTTGRASITNTPIGVSNTGVMFGAGRARFAGKAAIPVLSNGTDTFSTRIGFIDSFTGETNDGAFFRYTDGVNSGKWQAVTRNNGTETATDTGVTVVAATWQRFEIDVNAAGTSVVFKIDGSTVATNTTNIPTGSGRETGYGIMGLKSAGTTATSGGHVDYMEVEVLFTAQR